MAKPRTRIHSRREGWSCFGRVDLPVGHPPRQPIRLLATCLHFTHPCRHSPSPDSIPLLPLSSDDPHQDRVKTPRVATLQGLSTSTSQTSKAPSKRNFFTVFLSFFPMFFSHSIFHRCHLYHHQPPSDQYRALVTVFIQSHHVSPSFSVTDADCSIVLFVDVVIICDDIRHTLVLP